MIGLIIFIVLILYIYTANSIVMIMREKLKFERYKLHITTPSDPEIGNAVTSLCQDCLNDCILLNPDFIEITYISEAMENELYIDVSNLVTERMSQAFLDRLSLYYNSNNLHNFISTKIKILITSYVVSINSTSVDKHGNKQYKK